MRLLLLCLIGASLTYMATAQESYPLVPLPASIETGTGIFTFSEITTLVADDDFQEVAESFAALVRPATGFSLTFAKQADKQTVIFQKNTSIENPEGYILDVQTERIRIEAATPAGAFYAVQTLRQLLPPAIEKQEAVSGLSWTVPALHIEDEPRFGYRGMQLDVGRHFFSVAFIKRYLDLMALHKFNRFHWHLTEDQGWRIEIKQYPKLQEIAAYRDETVVGHLRNQPRQFDGKRYGGYYTQEEIRDIVRYAQERFITVIPEIEMPGHSTAALAAYPELGCTEGPFEVATSWGVKSDVYCPTEETFQFLENVLIEVMRLFPSEYIHIGGDEAPKTRWEESAFCQNLIKEQGLKDEHELQSYFIRRIEKFLNANGRKLIGWDEILEGGLAPEATVMSWRGEKGGIEAAKQGHDVIMTPNTYCYLDYYQSQSPNEPLAIGGYLPLETVYSYDPLPEELTPSEAKHILGAQANVWTEYISTPDYAEYMVFPRALALAEVNWTPLVQKDYTSFTDRLIQHFQRLDALEVNYARHLLGVDIDYYVDKKMYATLSSTVDNVTLRYTMDGSEPVATSDSYQKPIKLKEQTAIKAASFQNGERISPISTKVFSPHLAVNSKLEWSSEPNPSYNKGGKTALVNGVLPSLQTFKDNEWLGWDGDKVTLTLELDKAQSLKRIQLPFYNDPGAWVHLPQQVQIAVSKDGSTYETVSTIDATALQNNTTDGNAHWLMVLLAEKAQFIRLEITPLQQIPVGQPGAGSAAWLFVGELVVD